MALGRACVRRMVVRDGKQTLVVCGAQESDPDDPNTLVNPVVLAEVTSKSSEEYDRGEKFKHYRRIPSLGE